MARKINIAIGADGTGTTFEEIARAIRIGRLNARVVLLFSNNRNSLAVQKARNNDIPVLILDKDKTKEERGKILCNTLKNHHPKIDLICLAGYLRLIPECLVSAFPRGIINSHPALDLKRFGGKGMYGTHVTDAVIKAGLKETGSTIHFVTEIYDDPKGVIAKTKAIPVLPEDTPDSLLSRQLPQERALYIQVIKMFFDGRLP